MSLPPFLFSSAAPSTARSAFASSAGTASTMGFDAGGKRTGEDFRQAFMQLTQSKEPLAETPVSAEANPDPLLTKLNLLLDGDLLPQELQQSLRSFIEDLQEGMPLENTGGDMTLTDLLQQAELPQDQLNAVTAMLQEAMTDVTADVQQLPEVVAVLRDVVELLTGGKVLPVNPALGAVNVSETMLDTGSDMSAHVSPTALSAETASAANNLTGNGKSVDILQTEPGKRLDLSQWITGQEEKSENGQMSPNGQALKPEALAGAGKPSGFPADVMVKADAAASPMAALLSAESDLPESLSGPLAGAASVSSKGGVIAGLQPPADAPLPTAMRVQVAFGHAQWSEAVAERSAWLASQQIHSAELQLDPPELGPLQVRISVHQDQAVVSFVSANPQVREALDQSMMRLRELLQEQGMQLVDAGVSDQQRGDRDSGNGDTSEGLAAGNVAGQGPEIDPAQGGVVDTRYGVDDFV